MKNNLGSKYPDSVDERQGKRREPAQQSRLDLRNVRRFLRRILRYGADRELSRMCRSDNGIAVARAFRSALAIDSGRSMQACVVPIEQLRTEINASTESFLMTDYGVGQRGRQSTCDAASGNVVLRNIGKLSTQSSVDPFWGAVLFSLVREIRPMRTIEMGGLVGISAAYICAGLWANSEADPLAERGHLVTLEGDPTLSAMIAQHLQRLDLDSFAAIRTGSFDSTLVDVAAGGPPIDFAFVDGHHDEDATIRYYQVLRRYLSPGAIVVFDDIAWSAGMRAAWKVVSAQPEVVLAVSAGQFGILRCRSGSGSADFGNPDTTERYRLLLV